MKFFMNFEEKRSRREFEINFRGCEWGAMNFKSAFVNTGEAPFMGAANFSQPFSFLNN